MMRIAAFCVVILFAVVTGSFAQGVEELLTQANKYFISNKTDAARELYLKAAAMGSAEAHYQLASRFSLPMKEKVYHYSAAARSGHEAALRIALATLLFEADSLTNTDPQGALNLYYEAKKANPKVSLWGDDERTVRVMKMCIEPKGFNGREFIRKYKIEEKEMKRGNFEEYYIWELAEEASRGGRFGRPDPQLVLNLVIRGGNVPMEFISAVEETYGNWKEGTARKFDICKHVTSGNGANYCAIREIDEAEEKEDAKFTKVRARLPRNSRRLFDKAYGSATAFFEEKAGSEEGHGGTARMASVLSSQTDQKDQYLALVEKVLKKKFKPSPQDSLEVSDRKLNKTYQEVMAALKKEDTPPGVPAPEEVKTVQRLWIAYRDASVRLFVSMNPSIDEKTWKSWFTGTRCEELESVLERAKELME